MSKEIDKFSIVVGDKKYSGSIWSDLHDDYLRSSLAKNQDNLATNFLNAFKKVGNIGSILNTHSIIDLDSLLQQVVNSQNSQDKKNLFYSKTDILVNAGVDSTFSIFGKENFIISRYSANDYGFYIFTKDIKKLSEWFKIGTHPPRKISNNSLTEGGIVLDNISGKKFKIGFNTTYKRTNTNTIEFFNNIPDLIKMQLYLASEDLYNNQEFQNRIHKSNTFILLDLGFKSKIQHPTIK